MILNKITLVFIIIIVLTLVSLCYNKVSKKKDNKNLLLLTIMIFVFILFQLSGRKKIEKFNNNFLGLSNIREINLNKSKALDYENIPYSNKNEIKKLSINSDTLDLDTNLFETSNKLKGVEISNNTDIIYDKVKDSNISNLLNSDYKENTDFIDGSLERNYDFKIEDVNYLANINKDDESLIPPTSAKKINHLPINYPDEDRDIVVNSINNDLYNSFYDMMEDINIVPSSSNLNDSTGTSAGTSVNTSAGTSVNTSAGTSVNTSAGTSAGTSTGTSTTSYNSMYSMDKLASLTKDNNTTDKKETEETDENNENSSVVNDINNIFIKIFDFMKDFIINTYNLFFGTNMTDTGTGTSNETSEGSGTPPLVNDLTSIFIKIYIFIQDFTIKIFYFMKDFIINTYNLLFGTNMTDTGTGTSNENEATNETSEGSGQEFSLFYEINNLFFRIFKFLFDVLIKIYNLIEDFIISLFNFMFGTSNSSNTDS